MDDLYDELEHLTSERRALLALRLREQGKAQGAAPWSTIIPRAWSETAPLAFEQERIWLLHQLAGEDATFTGALALRLRGELDREVLRRSFAEILNRHLILRSYYPTVDGHPTARLLPHLPEILTFVDLSDCPQCDREAEALRLAHHQVREPFDLASGPLVRATLLQLDEADHLLVLTAHHIIFDAWSFGVFMRELTALYAAYRTRIASPLPPLPLQYADFAAWQREWLQGPVLEEHLSYWSQQLSGAPRTVDLPTDHLRPPLQANRGATQPVMLDAALCERLRVLGRHERASLFMTLLTAFGILLMRYTRQEDLVIGSLIANRTQPEIERLIGVFVNTLALRIDLTGNPSFSDALARVRDMTLRAYAHQDLPFEVLVEHLQPERDPSHNPLIQVLFALHNVPVVPLQLPGLVVTQFDLETETSKFDLLLHFWETSDGLAGAFEYDATLFDAETIGRMAEHFRTLLHRVVADPSQSVTRLQLLSETEHNLLTAWNATTVSYPTETCLHDLIAEQVERTPNAIAVLFEEGHLTYRDLDRRSNQVARHLQHLGIGPESRVGVYMERSLDLMVALLGVLKAGAAYVPVDPTYPHYPKERLAFMLGDAKVSVLLTQAHLLDALPEQTPYVIALDTAWPALSELSDVPVETGVTPANLAYIIYTSGSTGAPKGVMNTHRGICNRLLWMQDTFRLDATDRVLQKTPLSFDVSVWELFWPLLAGSALVMARPGGHHDSVYLVDVMAKQHITTVHFVPPMLQVWLDEPDVDRCRALRRVICSGEALPIIVQNRFFTRLAASLHNLYGPTEAAIDVTWWPCDPTSGLNTVPIGRPIANTQIHLLDSQLQPVPIGVPGELYIGGINVARGYLNRPDLTAERFIPDPFGAELGARLYRTGDLARYLPDGSIEFLGRLDHQVKIRGLRIELGEIEALLRQHSAVRDAIVLARHEEGGNGPLGLLIAYVVPSIGQDASPNELRRYLRERLPDYMVPAAFIAMPALPLTANGKVDRKALPVPEGRVGVGTAFIAPRTPTEDLLTGIWARLLEVEQVGIHDSFFELGGHSLLATQIVSQVRIAFGVTVPLRRFLEMATIASLAEYIDAVRQTGTSDLVPALVPSDRTSAPPLSFAQERLWFLDQLDPNIAAYSLPAAFRLRGSLDIVALHRALEAVVNRHEVLRTRITADAAGHPCQVLMSDVRIALPVSDLSHLNKRTRDAKARQFVTEEAHRPFDLAQGPLLRTRLLRLHKTEHIFLVTLHHIVSDGWSAAIFLRELVELYSASTEGRQPSLPSLPIQYADFARWQRTWLAGEVLERQVAYWSTQLAGIESLALPTDAPRPAVQSFAGAVQRADIPADLASDLRALGQREGVTLFMVLLAAFDVLLARWTGQQNIAVGTPVANRTRSELENLIGFFVNTLVLRVDLGGSPTFRETLARVRDAALGAYDHQDLPFEVLVEQLGPIRDLSRNPLFQVMFALQPAGTTSVDLPCLDIEELIVERRTAKFEISLSLVDTGRTLHAELEYNCALFRPDTIARLLQAYLLVLRAIVTDPGQKVGMLPMLTEAERQQILVEWNKTATEFAGPWTLPDLFEAQVQRTPDAVAVHYDGRELTYTELDRRADCLAWYLRRQGVGPEILVGLYMERSLDLPVAVLGVLKAGGTYVPLDAGYPRERLVYLLTESQPRLLLTQSGHVSTLAAEAAQEVQTVCIDSEWDQIVASAGGGDDGPPPRLTLPEHAAYVIYTSGSTGHPKGVLSTHRAICNRLLWGQATVPLSRDDRVLHKAPFSFDFAVWELFGPLIAGACVVLARPEGQRDPAYLLDLIRSQGITVTHFVPSMLQAFLEEPGIEQCTSLRHIFGGAEELPVDLERRFFARCQATLHNVYGPSETTIDATHWICQPSAENSTVPIGRPIANTQIYVLDRFGQAVPVGVPGEIYIGGLGLARGYLNHPELTAERFLPDPFGPSPGARMYRTGDQGRFLPDGTLEYCARLDHQVKVRGFRIEPSEIEAALRAVPGISQAAVVVREDTPGHRQLVAYLVPTEDTANDPTGRLRSRVSDLRGILRDRLPEYMVPATFVALPALPLNANGKVDRQQLPAPTYSQPEWAATYAPPRTPIEEALTLIWGNVLGIERVGIHDNFFDIGGDSLRSIQVRARATEAGLRFSLKQLFQLQTVARLASAIERDMSKGVDADNHDDPGASGTVPFALVNDGDRKRLPPTVEDAYPITALQGGMIFHSEYTAQSRLYHNTASFLLHAPLDLGALREATACLVARHPVLRTSFDLTHYADPLQLVHRPDHVDFPLEVSDLRRLGPKKQEAALARFLTAERQRRYDLARAPLFHFHIHQLGDDRFQFTMSEHHAILDGWSVASMLAEFWNHYLALLHADRDASSVPALHSTFRGYVALEQRAETSTEQRRFWDEQLAGCTVGHLPRWPGYPVVGAETSEARILPVPLTENLSDRLLDCSRMLGVPLKSVLLAAHVRVMSLVTGQLDVLTGLATNGRPETLDGEAVLGLFLNTVPFRMSVTGGTWQELIRQTFQTELELLPFRRYPLAQLQRARGNQPLFETAFNFVHFRPYQGILALPDVRVQVTTVVGAANFTFLANFSQDPVSDRVALDLEYDATTLGSEQVAAIGTYYVRALEALAEAIESGAAQQYEHCDLLPVAEREWILHAARGDASRYPRDWQVSQIFEMQVDRTPDATAVVAGTEEITYADLNRRANQLAWYLQQLGVRPELPVGICMERSIDMIVAMLGILKAGGAYVPLDPAYPLERLTFMLNDAGADVLITDSDLVARLTLSAAHVVRLDAEQGTIGQFPTENVSCAGSPDGLAYVMYTSGSTGRPKGVEVSHRGIVRLVCGVDYVQLDAEQVLLHMAPISFDLATFEVWGALLNGARVVLLLDRVPTLDTIKNMCAAQHITTAWLTASLFNVVIDGAPEALAGLSQIITGGEALSVPHIVRAIQSLPDTHLFNGYGPTEATTFTCCYRIPPSLSDALRSVPIGRPIANDQVYVLDAFGNLAPIGTPGEVYIGGDGVARGYHARPDLTAEMFVPHPFSRGPGARLYRTGDLACLRPDGTLDFLGRLDQQVKIRGFRVEPGEIEAVLSAHSAVREVVVALQEDVPGEKRLVAYLVLRAGASAGVEEFKLWMQRMLPNYMVPAQIVLLEALPLTANGKLDRGALPLISQPQARAGKYVAPRTEIEATVAHIWADLLQLDRVSTHANFFDLGGHSLLLIRMQAQLREVFERDIPITLLFQCPTINSLAAALSRSDNGPGSGEVVRERAAMRREMLRKRQTQRGQPSF